MYRPLLLVRLLVRLQDCCQLLLLLLLLVVALCWQSQSQPQLHQ
jgi:hypothetical protein